jgi:hypothetical protein
MKQLTFHHRYVMMQKNKETRSVRLTIRLLAQVQFFTACFSFRFMPFLLSRCTRRSPADNTHRIERQIASAKSRQMWYINFGCYSWVTWVLLQFRSSLGFRISLFASLLKYRSRYLNATVLSYITKHCVLSSRNRSIAVARDCDNLFPARRPAQMRRHSAHNCN